MTGYFHPTVAASTLQSFICGRKSCPTVKDFEIQSSPAKLSTIPKPERALLVKCGDLHDLCSFTLRRLHQSESGSASSARLSLLDQRRQQVQ
jgi:hypothetical protein